MATRQQLLVYNCYCSSILIFWVIVSTDLLEIEQQQSELQSVRIRKPQSRWRLWSIVALMVIFCLVFATWGVLLNVPNMIASSGHANTPNNITTGSPTVTPANKTLSARQIVCIVTLEVSVVLLAVVVLLLCCCSGSSKSPLSNVALLLIAFFTKPPGRPVGKNKSDANSSQASTGNSKQMKWVF